MATVLITGTSSGIGRGLAERFCEAGHEVWGIARRDQSAFALEQQRSGRSFRATCADISRWDQIESWSRESHIDSRTTSRRQFAGRQSTTLRCSVNTRSTGFFFSGEPLPSWRPIMRQEVERPAAYPASPGRAVHACLQERLYAAIPVGKPIMLSSQSG